MKCLPYIGRLLWSGTQHWLHSDFIFPDDDYFPCENCNGEFVVASDKLSAPEVGDGCDNVRWRHEKMKSMLQKMEVGNSFLWLLFNYTALLQFNICLDKFED